MSMSIKMKGRVNLIRMKERVSLIRIKWRVNLTRNEKTIMSMHIIV
jgi:hypothetical protein